MPMMIAVTAFMISVAFICFVLLVFNKMQERKRISRLLKQFNLLGSNYNLRFSSQEIMSNCVIGVDGQHRKVLILTLPVTKRHAWQIIHLDDVRNCLVKKTYKSTEAGENPIVTPAIEKIVLQFKFFSNRLPIEIPFYIRGETCQSTAMELEHKARDWEITFSKMLTSPLRKVI